MFGNFVYVCTAVPASIVHDICIREGNYIIRKQSIMYFRPDCVKCIKKKFFLPMELNIVCFRVSGVLIILNW